MYFSVPKIRARFFKGRPSVKVYCGTLAFYTQHWTFVNRLKIQIVLRLMCNTFLIMCNTCLIFCNTFLIMYNTSGYSGLEVACWPLVPKFAGSNPAKKSSARLPSEGKQSRLSHVAYWRHVKEPESVCVEVAAFGRNYGPFLVQVVPPFTTGVSGGDTWRCKQERLKTRVCTISLRLQCIRGHQPPGPYHIT